MPTTQRKLQACAFIRAVASHTPIATPFKEYPDAAFLTFYTFDATPELAIDERRFDLSSRMHRFHDYFGRELEDMDWKHLGSVLGMLEEMGHAY